MTENIMKTLISGKRIKKKNNLQMQIQTMLYQSK